jgi:hypothetical protein
MPLFSGLAVIQVVEYFSSKRETRVQAPEGAHTHTMSFFIHRTTSGSHEVTHVNFYCKCVMQMLDPIEVHFTLLDIFKNLNIIGFFGK